MGNHVPAHIMNANNFVHKKGERRGKPERSHFAAGKPVDAMNMKFQGDRSAFTQKAGRKGKLAGNYNGKKFRPVQVIPEEERRQILSRCEPRSAEEEAWDNKASLEENMLDFYRSDPMASDIARDPVVQRVLRGIDAYSMGSSWAEEDETSEDEYNF